MSDSLQPHGLQHARCPGPSPTPGACSNSCPWSHPLFSVGELTSYSSETTETNSHELFELIILSLANLTPCVPLLSFLANSPLYSSFHFLWELTLLNSNIPPTYPTCFPSRCCLLSLFSLPSQGS